MMFWKTGTVLEPQMFDTQTKTVTTMTISVPCQFVGAYSGYMTMAEDWISIPTRKGPDAVPACHDNVDIHPMKKLNGFWTLEGKNSETQ
jgi:hypothetical protein